MAGTQHDGQRQGEEYQQNEERDRDAETPPRLGRIDRGQGRRRFRRLSTLMAREHVLLVQTERLGIRAQEAPHEHVGRQLRLIVVLELLQDAHGNARGLGEFRDRNLPRFPLLFQIASE